MRVSVGRAVSAALVSANLRRSLHSDLTTASFRANLQRYLANFSQLVPEQWQTFRELQAYTSGHHLEVMFADRSGDQAAILLADAATRGGEARGENDPEYLLQLAHIASVTQKGQHYAIPLPKAQQSRADDEGGKDFVCFQLLSYRPGNKKYMQRLTSWSRDTWYGALMCAVLGTFRVPRDHNIDGRVGPPLDLQVSFPTSTVQPWPVQAFFVEDRVDHLYEFLSVEYAAEFDVSAVEDYNDEDHDHDLGLVNLGSICVG